MLVGAQAYREQYGLDAIFLLPTNLYGPRDNFDLETSHVIPALIRKMVEADDEVVLWGDGSPTREFLYVDDCVEGLVLAAERYDGADPVNLGAAREISIRDLAELDRRRDRVRGRDRRGTTRSRTASRAGASTPTPRARALRVRGDDPAARGDRAHRRVVPLGGRGCRYVAPRSPRRAGADTRSTVSSIGRAPSSERSSSRRSRMVVVLGLSIEHNGWVWFQGGDQIVITTNGWALGQRDLPPTELGYLWPIVQAPLTWITGPTYVQALPVLVIGQLLVLGPIALLCVYGIAAEIGGRLLGYWAALLWVIAPFAAIPLFVDRYHDRWTEQFLPQALGLTAMADFPSMVVVLAGALFVVRALSPGRALDAALAGLLIGAAAGLEAAEPARRGRRAPGVRGRAALARGRRLRRRNCAGAARPRCSGRYAGSATSRRSALDARPRRRGIGPDRARPEDSISTSTSTSSTGAIR